MAESGRAIIEADEISLRELVESLWRQRGIIASMVVIGAVLGGGVSLLSTRYVAEGLLLGGTPIEKSSPDDEGEEGEVKHIDFGIPVDKYKRYEGVLLNGSRLQRFLQQEGGEHGPVGQQLQPLIDSPSALAQVFKPEFGFTEKDAKTFGVRNEQPSDLIGVRVRYEGREPSSGLPVIQLAEFIRDTVIRVDLEDRTLDQCTNYRELEQSLRNRQLTSEFAVAQEQRLVQTLKEIIARLPASAVLDSRQIVAVEKGSERFLSPLAQLTAAEIRIADLRRGDIERERKRVASLLKRDYYCAAQQKLQEVANGRAFLSILPALQAQVFEGKDKGESVVEQTWNEIDLERESWINTYISRMRFVAPPEGGEQRERKPGLVLGLMLGVILGGMMGALVAMVAGWWRLDRSVKN